MTNPIAPQEAKQLLSGHSDEDLEHYATIAFNETGTALFEAAPRLAATIAADTIEYGIGIQFEDGMEMVNLAGIYKRRKEWTRDRAVATSHFSMMELGDPYRLVARRVSPTWEVKE